jgi:hypothetical protein
MFHMNLPRFCLALIFSLGLLHANAVTAQTPREDKSLDQARRAAEVAAQKVEADVRDALKQAQKQTDLSRAADILRKALTNVESASALSEERRESLTQMLKDRVRVTEALAEAKAATATERAGKQAQEESRKTTQEQRTRDQEQLQGQLREVNDLLKSGKTSDASLKAGELVRLFRGGSAAVGASSRVTGTKDQIASNRDLKTEADRRRLGAMREVEKSGLPPVGDYELPKDWKEKTKRRTSGPVMTAKEKAILQALDSPINVTFKDSNIQDAIRYLATFTGQPIILDKQAMDEAGVAYDSQVTLEVKGLTMRTVLHKILGDLGLTYVVREEAIQVTTPLKAESMLVTKVYYIGDLLASGGLPSRRIRRLIEIIQSTVEPRSWQENGGKATIVFDPATLSLVVKQSAEFHSVLANGLQR